MLEGQRRMAKVSSSLMFFLWILVAAVQAHGHEARQCSTSAICSVRKVKVNGLRKILSGCVLLPSSPGFANATHMFNYQFIGQRTPAVVVVPASAADVQKAVRFAVERCLRVSIKSGGHSFVGTGMRDGTLALDMSAFNSIQINKEKGEATVGPGVTALDLGNALTKAGYMLPLGHCPPVGTGGFTLGGGWGWNIREWGLLSSNLVSVDIVTAQGKLIKASTQSNQDYFWAAKGAGPGFFGVVTAFEYKLRPLPTIYATLIVLPVSQVLTFFRWYVTVEPTLKPYVDVLFLMGITGGQPTLLVEAIAFAPSMAEAIAALEPFASVPVKPLITNVPPFPTTVAGLQTSISVPENVKILGDVPLFPRGWDLKLLEVLVKQIEKAVSPLSYFVLSNISPHVFDAYPGPLTAQGVILEAFSIWDKTSNVTEKVHVDWFLNTMDLITPFLTERPAYFPTSSNYLLGAEHAVNSYDVESWHKLGKFRRIYDPNNVFVYWPSIDLDATKAALEASILGPYI